MTKQLNEGLKRYVYWNEYKIKIESRNLDNKNLTRFYFNTSFQGVTKLHVLAFNDTTANDAGNPVNNTRNRVERNSHRKYFLPRVNITNYNVLIDCRNIYDQSIIKSKSMMKLENLQQKKGIIKQLVAY